MHGTARRVCFCWKRGNEKPRGWPDPAARVECVGRLFGCVLQHSRQRVWARMEAATRLALAQMHALVFIEFTKTILEVLRVEVTQPDALQGGHECRTQALKLPAPAVLRPARIDRTAQHTVEPTATARAARGERHPIGG